MGLFREDPQSKSKPGILMLIAIGLNRSLVETQKKYDQITLTEKISAP
jgi:hypothetical protein